MRYFMEFSYDGSNFLGFQKQLNVRTIQDVIEDCLTKINSNHKVVLVASGRTDAKVHARGQCAHFDLDKKIDINVLKHTLNQMLPKDIYVKKMKLVDNKFHARFDVIKKEYIYYLNVGEYNPFERNYVYQYNKPLDIVKMNEAIKIFIGKHNFKGFTKVEEEKDFVREIYEVQIIEVNNVLEIHFIGNGFLRYMVRNMVGILIEIGNNQKNKENISELFELQDRKKAGIIAPPEGLYLNHVYYQ